MVVSGKLHVPGGLPRRMGPRFSPDRRMRGPQSQSGSGGEEKRSLPSQELNSGCSAHSVVTILTELPRHYKNVATYIDTAGGEQH
jgi:hypothetical protein